MKPTLDIDDRLRADAKAAAARERSTLTRLIEEGLALRLRKRSGARRRARSALPVIPGKGGLRPGIDPTSNRALFDALDE